MKRNLIYILFAILFSGCAMGPLLNHQTARTVGDGNHEIDAILAAGNYFGVKYTHGLTENLDLGVHYESLNTGLSVKYAFLNAGESDGLSASTSFTYGVSFGGSTTTFGVTGSYKMGNGEPYVSYRHNNVDNDSTKISDADTGEVFATVPSVNYSYGQVFFGYKHWIKDWIGVSLEGSTLVNSGELVFAQDIIYSLGVDFMI